MKKLYLSLFTLALLSLSGCGATTTTTQHNETTVITSSEEIATESSTTEETFNDVYSVAKALFDKGLITGQPTYLNAEMIHAVEGVKYSDQGVEIYEYDVSSDAYKSFSNGKSVALEGLDGYFVSASAINGKFVLIFSDNEDQSIIDAFSSLSGCEATTQQKNNTTSSGESTEHHIYDYAVILPATSKSEVIGEYSYIEMPSDEVTMDALIDWYYNYVEKNDYLYNIILYSDKDDLSGVFGIPGHIETNVVFTSYEFGDSSCSYVNAYPNSKTYTRNDEGTFTEITFDD